MREILFRGKRVADGKWLYGYYSDEKAEDTDFPCIVPLVPVPDYDWAVDSETVGQYIGLTDKNGKKVFEGDIVKANDAHTKMSFIGVVKFDNGSFYICDSNFNSHYRWMDYEVEIIGNIYDNPELLDVSYEEYKQNLKSAQLSKDKLISTFNHDSYY